MRGSGLKLFRYVKEGSSMEHYPDITLSETMYEPGNYHSHCSGCKGFFLGHRMSSTCKDCAEKWVTKYNSWTQQERAEFRKKQAEKVEAFFKNDYPKLKLFNP